MKVTSPPPPSHTPPSCWGVFHPCLPQGGGGSNPFIPSVVNPLFPLSLSPIFGEHVFLMKWEKFNIRAEYDTLEGGGGRGQVVYRDAR